MSIPVLEAALQRSESQSAWRAPRLKVIANGQIVFGAIEAEVISNNYYAADRFRASIALGIDPWAGASFWASAPDILLDVQFSLDGGASFVSLVQGVVDSVSIDPTLGLVRLDGRDLTSALIEARTQETFANRTSSEIASLLAQRHNLTPMVIATTTPVGRYYQNEHDRVTLNQFSRTTTEWDLLVFLARQEGFDVFVQGQALYFQPTAQATDFAVSLRPEDVIDIKLERSLTLAGDIEVVIKSWNSRQNSAFAQQARASGRGGAQRSGATPQCYVFVQPNLTPDEALKFAQQRLTELTRHERTIRISMPGDLSLSPRSMIALEGTGTEFDQPYYVDVIERRLRQNGGLTQFVMAKNSSPRTEIITTSSGSSGNAI
jgi:phage protein D